MINWSLCVCVHIYVSPSVHSVEHAPHIHTVSGDMLHTHTHTVSGDMLHTHTQTVSGDMLHTHTHCQW